ncbi:hypothetical protein [Buchananella hordeovulneris]|uniref:hypothetical protein n=1 Tax=Buchananella hordeovulneris TaxID=52770 RepID=UPI0026DB4164|nr:hypothetical protein [Buchananella hordeovulneris]MDO5080285.1 hypothetical protein [Buchananella hordeovulneris]
MVNPYYHAGQMPPPLPPRSNAPGVISLILGLLLLFDGPFAGLLLGMWGIADRFPEFLDPPVHSEEISFTAKQDGRYLFMASGPGIPANRCLVKDAAGNLLGPEVTNSKQELTLFIDREELVFQPGFEFPVRANERYTLNCYPEEGVVFTAVPKIDIDFLPFGSVAVLIGFFAGGIIVGIILIVVGIVLLVRNSRHRRNYEFYRMQQWSAGPPGPYPPHGPY